VSVRRGGCHDSHPALHLKSAIPQLFQARYVCASPGPRLGAADVTAGLTAPGTHLPVQASRGIQGGANQYSDRRPNLASGPTATPPATSVLALAPAARSFTNQVRSAYHRRRKFSSVASARCLESAQFCGQYRLSPILPWLLIGPFNSRGSSQPKMPGLSFPPAAGWTTSMPAFSAHVNHRLACCPKPLRHCSSKGRDTHLTPDCPWLSFSQLDRCSSHSGQSRRQSLLMSISEGSGGHSPVASSSMFGLCPGDTPLPRKRCTSSVASASSAPPLRNHAASRRDGSALGNGEVV